MNAGPTGNEVPPAGSQAADLVATVGLDHRVLSLNAAGRDMLGLAADTDATSMSFQEILGNEIDLTRLLTAAARSGVWSGDTVLHGLHAFVVVVHTQERFTFVARPTRDANERFLAVFERQLQSLEDAETIMTAASRLLGDHIGADRCAYAEAEPDEDHFIMSGDHSTGLPPLPGRFAMSQFGAACARAMRAGEPWVVADSQNDSRLQPADLAAYEFTGIRAVICLPLHKAGRFVAAMAVHQATVRHWTRAEIDLVGVVVNRCWESLQRTHSSRALRETENRYRLLVQRASDSIWIVDRDLRFVEVNPAACALLGYSRAEMLGKSVLEVVSAEHVNAMTEFVAAPDAARLMTQIWDVHRADGTVVMMELSIQATPTGLQAIGRDVTERQRVEAEREVLLQREHEIADALQRSLLPRQLPALARLAAAARYLPAATHAQTGGDWYDVLPITDTVVALCVGDVVGKGPTAAAVMGQLRSALAGYLLDGHSPAAALERLDTFARRTDGAVGTTCACLTLDWRTGRLRWALAGHPSPVIIEDGQARLLADDTGAVLGALNRMPYQEHGLSAAAGTSLLLYTDGLVERHGALIDEGLRELLTSADKSGALQPEALADTITATLLADGHDDDVALLVVRLLPEPLHRTVPATPQEVTALRRTVTQWAAATGLDRDLQDDLQLALSEAAANAVEHAYPEGPGEFGYEVARTPDGGVHVLVQDHGRWRPIPADNGFRGRGLDIIRTLATQADFDHSSAGTAVTFQLAPRPAGGNPASPPAAEIPAPPTLTVRDADTELRALTVVGDLDLSTVDDLRQAILGHIEATDRRHVDIDLTKLSYLSSCGIALLLEAGENAGRAGKTLTVTTTENTPPERILTLSGLRTTSHNGTRTVEITQNSIP
jgi:anti-anti-sigma factor